MRIDDTRIYQDDKHYNVHRKCVANTMVAHQRIVCNGVHQSKQYQNPPVPVEKMHQRIPAKTNDTGIYYF